MRPQDWRQLDLCFEDYKRWYVEGKITFWQFDEWCDNAIKILAADLIRPTPPGIIHPRTGADGA